MQVLSNIHLHFSFAFVSLVLLILYRAANGKCLCQHNVKCKLITTLYSCLQDYQRDRMMQTTYKSVYTPKMFNSIRLYG